jgi:hypothetical protein
MGSAAYGLEDINVRIIAIEEHWNSRASGRFRAFATLPTSDPQAP